MPRTPPGTRANYCAFRTLPTRWQDNDEYGHLNNATYYALFDTAVSLWQMEKGTEIRGPNATKFLVVESGCRYHAELSFPDMLTAGIRVAHIGTSSFRYEIALFGNDEDTAGAEGFFTQVYVDSDGRPAPLSNTVLAILTSIKT
ncbi:MULTISPECIES: acyl-CoA thioesterase [Marivita]|uniref:Acyl-CoA thioesterase n=1 Tax=Marivita cryptomonadis TaxID=505252 RepID=A0A9Q2P694_9RHOB|nr:MULTISPECIES: thioesterase family protein [Marivita]MBM2319783.1 acyl-CoA thioesterase [Marivita cryptomonadis]MBM2329362.1 acyl-CoA thioesterase [Marivita cryptomonadis]MBM2338950.1 acyl-CoA thioesterase [Marivita cryptomonadis]MBM2343608.1 acyl-CoA thioesterase [Marivita cryptomonadis]MBM2348285.1 acyl-CoA thioesterase [Marivita cryptomonadis]